MGVDLDLLPFDCDHGSFSFSHTILTCFRRRELWDVILKLPALPVSDEFISFRSRLESGDPGYGVTVEDPYGDRVKYTTVQYLLTLRNHDGVQDNPKNRAIWAYLAELDPQTKVTLYWH